MASAQIWWVSKGPYRSCSKNLENIDNVQCLYAHPTFYWTSSSPSSCQPDMHLILKHHSASKIVRNLSSVFTHSCARSKLRKAKCSCHSIALSNYIESDKIKKLVWHIPVSSQSAALVFGIGGTTVLQEDAGEDDPEKSRYCITWLGEGPPWELCSKKVICVNQFNRTYTFCNLWCTWTNVWFTCVGFWFICVRIWLICTFWCSNCWMFWVSCGWFIAGRFWKRVTSLVNPTRAWLMMAMIVGDHRAKSKMTINQKHVTSIGTLEKFKTQIWWWTWLLVDLEKWHLLKLNQWSSDSACNALPTELKCLSNSRLQLMWFELAHHWVHM